MGCINWMVLQKSKKLKSGVLLSQRINHYAPFSHVLLTPRHAKGDWASARYRIRFSVQNSIMTTTGQRADIFLRVSNPEGFYLLDIWSYSTPTFNFANLWKKKDLRNYPPWGFRSHDHRFTQTWNQSPKNLWQSLGAPTWSPVQNVRWGRQWCLSGQAKAIKTSGFWKSPKLVLEPPVFKKKRNWKIFFSFRVENEKLCETTTWAKLFGH